MVENIMNIDTQLQAIDRNLEEDKKAVDLASALNRLSTNKDFREVIKVGYFEKEAIRLVLLKADINMQSPERQEAIIKAIDSIGFLHQYFNTINQLASIATKSIEYNEEAREELLQENK